MKLYNWYLLLPKLFLVALISVAVSGCASGPIEPAQPPSNLSVAKARAALVEDGDTSISVEGQVLWGGVILKTENLADATQVEILGYPLNRRQRPLTGNEPQGRFVARYKGFVEPLDLPVGRSLTVLGTLGEPVAGKVGEASYIYPEVIVTQAHLWRPQELRQRPRFSFGLGVGL